MLTRKAPPPGVRELDLGDADIALLEDAISVSKPSRSSPIRRNGSQKPPDVSAEQRASNELVKLIRKLRWIGMEKEAVGAEMQLAMRRVRPAVGVLAGPHNTD